jgi:hypothetical protein
MVLLVTPLLLLPLLLPLLLRVIMPLLLLLGGQKREQRVWQHLTAHCC